MGKQGGHPIQFQEEVLSSKQVLCSQGHGEAMSSNETNAV